MVARCRKVGTWQTCTAYPSLSMIICLDTHPFFLDLSSLQFCHLLDHLSFRQHHWPFLDDGFIMVLNTLCTIPYSVVFIISLGNQYVDFLFRQFKSDTVVITQWPSKTKLTSLSWLFPFLFRVKFPCPRPLSLSFLLISYMLTFLAPSFLLSSSTSLPRSPSYSSPFPPPVVHTGVPCVCTHVHTGPPLVHHVSAHMCIQGPTSPPVDQNRSGIQNFKL